MSRIISFAFLLCLFGGLALVGRGFIDFHFPLSSTRAGGFGEGYFRSIDHETNRTMGRVLALDGDLSGLEYKFLGDAGPLVNVGCSKWLFLTEEAREYPDGTKNLNNRIRIAGFLTQKFQHGKTKLIILPVPDKAELAQVELCNSPVSKQAKLRSSVWQERTRSLSSSQIDLVRSWPAPGFLRTDSHWDEHGAHFAAMKTAREVFVVIGKGRDEVSLTVNTPVARAGDLVRLAGLLGSYSWSGPPPDEVSKTAAHVSLSGGLLDVPKVPRVLLAGSSFSLNSGFHDFLQYELSEAVLQLSKQGSGFAGTMFDVVRREDVLAGSFDVIIWEFPMRALTQPLTPAEKDFLRDAG
jgi:alginate O-acetyltransferase complex protein AlgJ